MDTVWILPPGSADPSIDDQIADGDHLLREDEGDIHVWRVDGGRAEWLTEVPADQLPLDPEHELRPSERQPLENPHDLLVALNGITEALRQRGG